MSESLSEKKSDFSILSEYKDMVRIYFYDGEVGSLNKAVGKHKPDVVFHLASLFLPAHNEQDITPLITSNILYSTQLVEAMINNGCHKLINTGTSWQHYNNSHYEPVCLYAATKQAFEAILKYYVSAHDLRVITLKLYDTYGIGDPRKKLMSLLCDFLESGKTLGMSPGEQLIDIVHIKDVISAFHIATDLLLSNKETVDADYAVSSSCPIKLRDLVGLFESISGKRISINWGSREYREREVMKPWGTSFLLPQWKPAVTLEEGIGELIKSFHDNRVRQVLLGRVQYKEVTNPDTN